MTGVAARAESTAHARDCCHSEKARLRIEKMLLARELHVCDATIGVFQSSDYGTEREVRLSLQARLEDATKRNAALRAKNTLMARAMNALNEEKRESQREVRRLLEAARVQALKEAADKRGALETRYAERFSNSQRSARTLAGLEKELEEQRAEKEAEARAKEKQAREYSQMLLKMRYDIKTDMALHSMVNAVHDSKMLREERRRQFMHECNEAWLRRLAKVRASAAHVSAMKALSEAEQEKRIENAKTMLARIASQRAAVHREHVKKLLAEGQARWILRAQRRLKSRLEEETAKTEGEINSLAESVSETDKAVTSLTGEFQKAQKEKETVEAEVMRGVGDAKQWAERAAELQQVLEPAWGHAVPDAVVSSSNEIIAAFTCASSGGDAKAKAKAREAVATGFAPCVGSLVKALGEHQHSGMLYVQARAMEAIHHLVESGKALFEDEGSKGTLSDLIFVLAIAVNEQTVAPEAHCDSNPFAALMPPVQLSKYEPPKSKARAKEVLEGAKKELELAKAKHEELKEAAKKGGEGTSGKRAIQQSKEAEMQLEWKKEQKDRSELVQWFAQSQGKDKSNRFSAVKAGGEVREVTLLTTRWHALCTLRKLQQQSQTAVMDVVNANDFPKALKSCIEGLATKPSLQKQKSRMSGEAPDAISVPRELPPGMQEMLKTLRHRQVELRDLEINMGIVRVRNELSQKKTAEGPKGGSKVKGFHDLVTDVADREELLHLVEAAMIVDSKSERAPLTKLTLTDGDLLSAAKADWESWNKWAVSSASISKQHERTASDALRLTAKAREVAKNCDRKAKSYCEGVKSTVHKNSNRCLMTAKSCQRIPIERAAEFVRSPFMDEDAAALLVQRSWRRVSAKGLEHKKVEEEGAEHEQDGKGDVPSVRPVAEEGGATAMDAAAEEEVATAEDAAAEEGVATAEGVAAEEAVATTDEGAP